VANSANGSRSILGVGIIGTGLAFQAIHARVLADLTPLFAITAVWDSDVQRSAAAAAWLDVRAARDLDDLLADPAVDLVVIASPARFHAAQAIAAMRAGKRAVLIEKPLCATPDEADEIATAARLSGAAVLVGAMHSSDPAWLAAEKVLAEANFAPSLVRSSIVIPPNACFEDWATEAVVDAQDVGAARSPMQPAELMRLCVLELAIHDLPLVRRLLPQGAAPCVLSARLRRPFGYAITLLAGGVLVDMSAIIHGNWETDWNLEATASDARLKVAFTPSFVPAGSGTMIWQTRQRTIVHEPAATNGYVGQWEAIAAILNGERPAPDPCDLAEDFRFAWTIAEQAVSLLEHEVPS